MPGRSLRRYPSPLRYPGGKGKLSTFLRLLFLENGLTGYQYVEPYAGGAAVALTLLFEEYASHIHINDLNRSVFAFWDAVLHRTEALVQRIVDTPVTLDEWKRQRSVQEQDSPDPLDLGFSTFFLNRTNRSGIIRGGVIGGQEQRGRWKIDARYNRPELVRRIRKVARFRSRISLTQLDATEFLRRELLELPEQTLVYLDPPYYYTKGARLYEDHYDHEGHQEIARTVQSLTRPWIVSYDASPEVMELYPEAEFITYGLSYSAASRYRGGEIMFFSPDLTLPDQDSPAGIPVGVADVLRAQVAIPA